MAKLKIGQNLYQIFKYEVVCSWHQKSFELGVWWADEFEFIQKWLIDPTVVKKLDN